MRTISYKALGTKGWSPTENKGWFYGTSDVNKYCGENAQENQIYNLAVFEKYIKGNYIDKNTRCQGTGIVDTKGIELYDRDIITAGNYTYLVEIQDDMRILLKTIEHLSLRAYSDMYFYEFEDGFEFTIIDNLFSNPKILEK